MNIERASIGLTEVKFAADSATKGTFSGYGAVFGNVDAYGDTIQKGAFKKSLGEWEARGKLPPMLLQHGGMPFSASADSLLPIGKWTEMEENSRGLRVEGQLFALSTERGQYLMDGLKAGVLDGLSIGFRMRQAVNGTKPGEPRRTLTDLDLVEVSVVTFPANPKARVTAVKSVTAEEIRELEAALRDAGLSRKDAVIASTALRDYLQRDAAAPIMLPRDAGSPAPVATLADLLKTARKVRAGMLGAR